ncbi:uncharacterized protein LOC133289473 [Gastrolobium bilobum]|uniref:uncharacterized protein LOC133287804 n=1 Tax=Gastrolobium bilobum TaxID=150636 RepID=UPI002AB11A68|nr:uncharacterized protein LOC133287804 [Gastrolobium bilobum]XP_061343386.1 uncharacterized protein LOC133289473 [Gastrolobium bilobum]
MTIDQYFAKFNELVKYANYGRALPTPAKMTSKFQWGLNEKMSRKMSNCDIREFSKFVNQCRKVEEVYGVPKSKKSSEAQASGASGATGSTSEKGKKMDDRNIKEKLQVRQSEEKFKRSGSQQSWDSERPIVPKCDNCGRHHKGVCLMGQNVCFKCARPGHYARDCPQIVGWVAHVQVVYDPSAAAHVSTSTQPQLERFPHLTGGMTHVD